MKIFDVTEVFFDVTEVASMLSTSRNTILNWIKTGKLKAFRIGKKWLIYERDLQKSIKWSK